MYDPRPFGPAMSGDHRALIEEAGEHRQSPSGGMWCFLCRADWPCLPARLAEALAELHDHLQQASDEIRELAADRDAVLERAEQVEDALKKSAAYIRELERERAGARRAVVRAEARAERLAGYAEHRAGCSAWKTLVECICGLSAALGLAGDREGQ